MMTSAKALKILTDAVNSPQGTNPDYVCVFAQRFINCYNEEHQLDCIFKYNGHAVNVAARKVGYPDDYYVANWYGKHETGQYFDGRTFSEAVTNFANLCDAFDHKDERAKPVPTPTVNERRLKAAFLKLLEDYRHAVNESDDYCYCYGDCPFREHRENYKCPGAYRKGNDAVGYFFGIDTDKCREAILDWYMNDANRHNGGK